MKDLSLRDINCPICGEILKPRNEESRISNSFADCLRRCDNCNVGFSNGKDKPTLIYNNYEDNVPAELRSGLDLVLNNSLNQVNRKNKIKKFSFSTSEDALTWSFFKYFVIKNRFQDLLNLLNIESDDSYFDIYLWGINICSIDINTDLYRQFIQISDSFNEEPIRRTEPDVIIKLTEKLIFIEVKYQSPNEVIADTNKFKKYYISDIDYNKVVESGHYELFRNWAFLSKLSNGTEFKLINLGLSKLFKDKNKEKLKLFEESITCVRGNFSELKWEDIISKMNENEYDSWFLEYLKLKIREYYI